MTDSSLHRIVGVLVSPSNTFRALRERPTWLAAFVFVALVTGVIGQIGQTKVDPEAMIRDLMKGSGSAVSEESIEEIVERQENQSPIVAGLTSLAFVAIIPVLCALYFWLGTRLFGGEPGFGQILSTVVHSLVPWWALKALLSLPVFLSSSELTVTQAASGVLPSNLAVFLGEGASPFWRSLATSLDLFTIWGLGLLVVGVSIVARIPKAASGALTFFVWLLILGATLLPMMLPALLSS